MTKSQTETKHFWEQGKLGDRCKCGKPRFSEVHKIRTTMTQQLKPTEQTKWKYLLLILFIISGQMVIWDLWHNIYLNIINILTWFFALKVTIWKK